MFKRLADNRETQSLAVRFRRKRFAFFCALLSRLERPVRILDIGGTATYWKTMGLDDHGVSVTVLNLIQDPVTVPYVASVVGDARNLQAEDKSFDVIFSNSVIEHVGSYQDQLRMAEEVCRVGKRHFVQTPNKYFPLEPHFLFPFFQFLPVAVRIKLLQNFSLGWFRKTPDPRKAREIVESIRLLDKRELVSLFPQSAIYEERFFGMTKSFVAYGGWNED